MAHNLFTRIKFLKSARKHRIGKADARYVIEMYEPIASEQTEELTIKYKWIGEDTKGRELEIAAEYFDDFLIVFHVMPTIYRRKRNG